MYSALLYVLAFVLYVLPVALIAALWHVLRRRRLQNMAYRKRVARRTAGGLGLLGVYLLSLLGVAVWLGYGPAINTFLLLSHGFAQACGQ